MNHGSLSITTQNGLAVYYLCCALLNLGFFAAMTQRRARLPAMLGFVGTAIFLVHAALYWPMHRGLVIPPEITHAVDAVTNATTYFIASTVLFAAVLLFRGFFTEPNVAWILLNLVLLVSGWAMTNEDFRNIITKPDNVPIVMLLFTVGFFTWLGLRRAVLNDNLIAKGAPPLEKDDEKVLVWPDLVYTEMICMIVCTALLVVWAIYLKAPLEAPATTARAPNPSKAPWYFLGLQEMLVYFDPWMAGVVLPTFIIIGLCAIPYIDFNQKGNGYYTFRERPFAMAMFLYGFLVLWVVLIVLGTFLRGPNWNFFGPFENWDPHKSDPLNNINLATMFWRAFGMDDEAVGHQSGWLVRELPGIIVVIAYFMIIPPLLAKTVFKRYFMKMGFIRYMLLMTLILFMASLPLKMVLRWTLNLKYIVYIPELFFNI
ncbi:MAG: hypothetical protein ACJ8C4_11640 [Gemmataceae bacterium]